MILNYKFQLIYYLTVPFIESLTYYTISYHYQGCDEQIASFHVYGQIHLYSSSQIKQIVYINFGETNKDLQDDKIGVHLHGCKANNAY
jgi:hypothetical protein